MNYQMNGSKGLNGLKRSMAFILMLAMVITSLGIAGWGVDQVYAADGDGTATVRIVGPNNQFVITEASIDIVDGVTTLGAVVAKACADHGRNFELNANYYPGSLEGVPLATDKHSWMSKLNDSGSKFSEAGKNFTNITANNGDRIVLYQDSLPSSVEYSQFTILTHSAVTTSAGWPNGHNIEGTVTLNLEKAEAYPLTGFQELGVSAIVVQDVDGNKMIDNLYSPDYYYSTDIVYSDFGPVRLKFNSSCSEAELGNFSESFIITSEENGIVKPYLRIEMTSNGFNFSQPLYTAPFAMGDPFVSHNDAIDASELITAIGGEDNSRPTSYYDNDWALAMFAAGKTPSETEKKNYLIWVLDKIVDSYATIGTKAKTAIALATVGIDATSVPNRDTGGTINLVKQVIDYEIGPYDGAYVLPYILSLLDLEPYKEMEGAASQRTKAINGILASESGWATSNDQTGMILPALAPYYNAVATINGISLPSCQAITSVISSAATRLANNMGDYGGFPAYNSLDSNTQALVLIGLHAIKEDTHPVAKGNFYISATAIDNLLFYKTSDNKLGYKFNKTPNEMSSKQGMGALATYQNMMYDTGRSSNLYHFDKTVTQYTEWPDADLLTGIQVFPDVTNYNLNQTVDPKTLTVQAIYNGDYSTATTVAITADNVTHAAFTTAGNFTVTVNYLGELATYVVSVTDPGATPGTAPVGPSISATIREGSNIIAYNANLMIVEDQTTALDALKILAAEKGVSIVVRGGYVSQINGLGEFDKGNNSGWLYRVGTYTPEEGAGSHKLEAGNELVWYYTLDYTRDSGSSKWVKDEEKVSELVAKEDGKGSATVGVTKADMDKLIKDGSSLKAKSSVATIEMDADTLKGLGNEMGKDLEITVKKIDISNQEGITQEMKDKIGDRPVLDLTVMSGTKQISEFDGQVKVSIPYTLKEGEDPSTVVLYLLRDDGKIEIIKNASFNPRTGEVSFTTNHFSLYGIGYKALTFNDIKGHWAKDHISYLAARDYITGMSKDSFAPNGTLTRGQFVQLLANLADADLDKYGSTLSSSINDVKASDWFAPAVAWAVEQGVVTGVILSDGTTSFYPEKSISRQDIAVMLNRYRDKIDKKEFPEAVKEKAFQDKEQIGDYAADAVKVLQMSGIIQGKSETTFAPLDQAKRGEAAKMIHGMLKLN